MKIISYNFVTPELIDNLNKKGKGITNPKLFELFELYGLNTLYYRKFIFFRMVKNIKSKSIN